MKKKKMYFLTVLSPVTGVSHAVILYDEDGMRWSEIKKKK